MTDTKPLSQAASAKQMYDARSSKYDDSWHPAFVNKIIDLLDLQPGEKVLDLACGTGLVSFAAARKVGPAGSVTGIDVSDGMLREAIAKLEKDKEAYPQIQFINHDITALPSLEVLKEGTFDAVTCASALVLLRSPGDALVQWAKYLKPGGRLLTDVAHPNNLHSSNIFERVHQRLALQSPSSRWWVKSEDSFKLIVGQAGFDLDQSKFTFVENAGFDERYRRVDEAEKVFEDNMKSEFAANLRAEGVREQAKVIFLEEWAKMADADGKILEKDGSFVTVARKPLILPPSNGVVSGSCACGAVKWIATCAPSSATFCHCTPCRKISGSAFIAFMGFPKTNIKFTSVLSTLKSVELSSHAERAFCGSCGSALTMSYHAHQPTIYVTMGTMDEDRSQPGILEDVKKIMKHIYTKEPPSWYELPDDGLEKQHTMEGAAELLGSDA
jgi:ubiquinone/menaquinone biosynthesis C-methylase UbiE